MLVAGASGFAGALAASLRLAPSAPRARGRHSRGDAGTRLDRLYPRYRVPVELTSSTSARAGARRGDRRLSARGGRGGGRKLRRARACRWWTSPPTSDCTTWPIYEQTYGDHGAPELLADAVYGLPELHRDGSAGARLVANPGCYPTAAMLALAPLAEAGLADDVVISAASGVSGAGRVAGDGFTSSPWTRTSAPYGVEGHRHLPEIIQELRIGAGPVTFVPHLCHWIRGCWRAAT